MARNGDGLFRRDGIWYFKYRNECGPDREKSTGKRKQNEARDYKHDFLEASLADLIRSVKAQGLEGLVAKRIDSRYEPGQRSGAWQKMYVNRAQECVIGGYAKSPVFFSKSGKPLDRGRVRVILRRAAKMAGVSDKTPRISPHWLRHAHASHALDHGAPIHLFQATLGHRSVVTTSAYLHARPADSSARFLTVTKKV